MSAKQFFSLFRGVVAIAVNLLVPSLRDCNNMNWYRSPHQHWRTDMHLGCSRCGFSQHDYQRCIYWFCTERIGGLAEATSWGYFILAVCSLPSQRAAFPSSQHGPVPPISTVLGLSWGQSEGAILFQCFGVVLNVYILYSTAGKSMHAHTQND